MCVCLGLGVGGWGEVGDQVSQMFEKQTEKRRGTMEALAFFQS